MHLQNTCPEAKKETRRKKKTGKQPQGWQFPPHDSDEEVEVAVEDPTPNQNNQADNEPEAHEKTPQDPMESQPKKMPKAKDSNGAK